MKGKMIMSDYKQQIDMLEERISSLEDELTETKELLTNMTATLILITNNLKEHSDLFDGVYQIQNKTVDMITSIENRLNGRI